MTRPHLFGLALLALGLFPGVARAATITVDSTADGAPVSDGACTLREAVLAAETDAAGDCAAGSGDDRIVFAPSLTDATIVLSATLAVTSTRFAIDGESRNITLSGNHAVRILDVHAPALLNVLDLTLAHGRVASGDTEGGAALRSRGAVTLVNCRVVSNSAGAPGGGVAALLATPGTSHLEIG